MKLTRYFLAAMLSMALLSAHSSAQEAGPARMLKLHAIFDSDMVLQRRKPIVVWGWSKPGDSVSVQLGSDEVEAKAAAGKGRWEVTLPAREASAEPQTLTVTVGKSPSHPGSVYNGMFGVFKGYNIKGVLLHHGYNNAMTGNVRPKFYRWITKALIEGVREDFNDPKIAYVVE